MAMEKKFLIINTGSSSKKYAFFYGGSECDVLHFEKDGKKYLLTQNGKIKAISEKLYRNSLKYTLDAFVKNPGKIAGVALRIVSPGGYFQMHRRINSDYLKKLKNGEAKAPLHIRPVLQEIALLGKLLPQVPLLGISDSAFHSTLAKKASCYALPQKLAAELEIFRYGYHGISCASIVAVIPKIIKTLPPRMIICHLGSGASITAVKNGRSIDTSMGFSPLEGIPMSSRVGDIDPEALLYILRRKKVAPEKLLSIFYHKSGLLGVSGISNDMRELLAEESKSSSAKNAIDIFVYRIQKYIGAYTAVLGGLDCLVFTGTMGERSFIIRRKICSALKHFRVVLDGKKNSSSCLDMDVRAKNSIPILVIHSREMFYMAKELNRLLKKRRR